MRDYRSIDEIKEANATTGQRFFEDPKVAVASDVVNGRYFVSYMPEHGPPDQPYFVHEVDSRGMVMTHPAGPYDTQAQAAVAIAGHMANGRWMENPSLRPFSENPGIAHSEERRREFDQRGVPEHPFAGSELDTTDELPREISLKDELRSRESHVREAADRAPNERIRAYRLGRADAYKEMRIALECGYTLGDAHEKVLDLRPGTDRGPRPSGWERYRQEPGQGMRLRRHL